MTAPERPPTPPRSASALNTASSSTIVCCQPASGLAVAPRSKEFEDEEQQALPENASEKLGRERVDNNGEFCLSQRRKWALLSLFCLGVFLDVLGVCSFYILLTPVATTLDIVFEQQTWIITSFGVTFASFLLFWGRFADLYSPQPVFCGAFLSFGILNLIISFLNDKYSYLIIRGLTGVTAAALIPASYRLITSIFEQHELPRAFTVYSLSGSAAGACGVTIGGLMTLIPNGGQMQGWRWFFRITAGIVIPTAIWSFYAVPNVRKHVIKEKHKWRRLDIPGTLLILFAILLFILSLTLGASYGWDKPGFIVPLVLSVFLFPSFFFWESRIHPTTALIPPVTWKGTNFSLWILLSTFGYAWWTMTQIPAIQLWSAQGDEPIISALRLLPSGAGSISSSLVLIAYPKWTVRPRIGFTVGQIGGAAAYGLFIASKGYLDSYYWRYYFPGILLGSFFNNVSITTAMIGAMTSAPSEQAGVVGALLQAAIQTGNVIGLTVQAGLETIYPGGTTDFRNVAASWYFVIGWGVLYLGLFWVFYRPTDTKEERVVAVH